MLVFDTDRLSYIHSSEIMAKDNFHSGHRSSVTVCNGMAACLHGVICCTTCRITASKISQSMTAVSVSVYQILVIIHHINVCIGRVFTFIE